ncbi:MAG: SRPBCC family protein [Phycisphaerales bacterium]|nr:SRPBCC family protein [Planctomycetota bacterium]
MSREPYVLEMVQEVPRALAEVFPFFAAPENLEAITPPWLRFRILTPSPIPMREGALIDYRISLRGIPLRWRTRIDAYEPPRMFIDRQIRGPYLLWEHTHLFEEVADGRGVRTRMTDRVRYMPLDIPRSVPLLGGLVHRLFVRGELERIFSYRRRKLEELLLRKPGAEQSAAAAGKS